MLPKPTCIALVDDHNLFRSGIANLLQEFDDIKVVFQAANGKELQQLLPQYAQQIAVILMDINMPGMDGYAATAWIKENHSHIHVLALSMLDEETAIIKMLKAGAGGYILKESSIKEVHKAILEIIENGFYSSNLLTSKMIANFQKRDIPDTTKQDIVLSQKEIDFLILCASELTYKEMADTMGIATRSVENYRQILFEKLNLKSRVGLALEAIRRGLVKL